MNENILDGLSMNLEQANMDKLKSIFPECFAEGKLDIDKLLSLCGEYIDNDFEKYKFEWKGKAECLRLAQKRSTGTLRPCPEESVNWDTTKNLYIEGDNLEVLKLLQTAYYRKVKMIYIDPPYNTGNDFVYEDDFADPLARYKEVTQQTTKSNPETMGRYHTNWLNMMYPRLRLAANLLRDDGVIFISIDDNEVTNLRKICDEVFGEENFVGMISWFKKASPSNDAQYFSNDIEYIVVYAKQKIIWSPNRLPLNEKQMKYYQNPDNDPRGAWNSSTYTCNKTKAERPNLFYSITNPFTGKEVWPKETAVWAYSKAQCEQHIKENLLFWGIDGNAQFPRFKKFLTNHQGVVNRTLWHYDDVNHTQGASQELQGLKIIGFSTPKPSRLIEKILRIASDKDSIILDFFSGSATTAHAVMQLNAEDGGNRRFIMVQLPEVCDEKSEAYKAGYKNICEIGKERIRRAGKKILEENNQMTLEDKEQLDIGFKVFRLDSSNLKTWDNTPVTAEQMDLLYERMNNMIHRVKSERSDLDMVCEIMLKLGVPLTYSITAVEINGKTAYSIGDDCLLLICLAEDVQPEDVEQMAEYAPAKLIISRESFVDDTAMANAHYILKDHGVELKLV
ncbi:site-specific DNA-methyltransferase [Anaerotignum lactatifermentans]|jgi:site-specific DNA-methyltransferase (adenine-specific)|uniref:Site-specific DNA-methyltransferase n=1 Tax=Anaerotignum lactatifermentans TaxID=160404 RepID=A0A1Y3TX91_9FIRM|nr:site-specific DNA-methyltransferase [Anaerotignum lactatifermentans]OUN41073.1 site-specific DNA-methyltransferase [Anaerotignum lactatifermentans]